MAAMSPGRNRLVRFLVRRSTRTTPPEAGAGHGLARSTARSPTRTEILIGTILPGPPGLARPTAPVLNTPSAGRDEVVTSFLTHVRPGRDRVLAVAPDALPAAKQDQRRSACAAA